MKLRLLAAAFAVPLLTAGTASAGGFHVHIGGGAHWGGHWGGGYHWGGGSYRAPHVHWHTGGSVVVRGGIWVGGGYYDPYYYPTYTTYATPPPACECGPSAYYPPVYPAPSTYAAAVAQPEPMPTFGVGLFAGGTSTATTPDGSDVGLFANLRISRGLLVQGEMGKTSIDNGARVDRRFEGALVWEIGAENNWAPYILGGLGVETADTSDVSATQNFGELGAGIRWAVSRGFHLTADIRAGSRETMTDNGNTRTAPGTLAAVAPPPADSGQSEDFTRFRLGAMIYF
ncbi:MAG TPA: outer membrane beta-barrel protein [Kofleriaceae bacterium]|nr:outer membrane beta-barrel protein [Kofleriaceae bacterium]